MVIFARRSTCFDKYPNSIEHWSAESQSRTPNYIHLLELSEKRSCVRADANSSTFTAMCFGKLVAAILYAMPPRAKRKWKSGRESGISLRQRKREKTQRQPHREKNAPPCMLCHTTLNELASNQREPVLFALAYRKHVARVRFFVLSFDPLNYAVYIIYKHILY